MSRVDRSNLIHPSIHPSIYLSLSLPHTHTHTHTHTHIDTPTPAPLRTLASEELEEVSEVVARVEGDPPHVVHQDQARSHHQLPEAEHLDAVPLRFMGGWAVDNGGREGGK